MKKLIPAAVLMTLAGAAQAQVTMYGLVDMSYGKNEITFPGQKDDVFSGGDNGSSQGNSTTRVGIKGSSDVGSGVKANFQFETNGITSNGDVPAPFFNRAAWAGFSGSFGEIRVGKQDSVAFQTMAGFDLNGASNSNAAGMNALVAPWLRGRQDRSVQYISPVAGGFKVQVGFQPEGQVAGAKSNGSIGVSYSGGPLGAAVVMESARNAGDKDFYSVGGTYDLGVVKLALGYADGGTGFKGTTIGAVAPIAGLNVGFQLAKNSDTNAMATEIFVNKEIFKNTYAYAEVANLDKTANGFTKGDNYAIGFIYVF
ncbi:MAG: porin [Rhodoferax sp.]|nr:porin [Rhodoferax sp.]